VHNAGQIVSMVNKGQENTNFYLTAKKSKEKRRHIKFRKIIAGIRKQEIEEIRKLSFRMYLYKQAQASNSIDLSKNNE